MNKIIIGGKVNRNDNGALTNIDIDKMLKKVKTYNGCFSIDNIPRIKKIGSYIINTKKNNDYTVGHWVYLWVGKDCSIYMDSYGASPPDEIFVGIKMPLYFNNEQYQDMNSSWCGNFCLCCAKIMNSPSYGKSDKIKMLNFTFLLSPKNLKQNKNTINRISENLSINN